jgi:glycosyltransferase involved in cell wall biosynthesis
VTRRALVLDVAYSLRTVRERELEQAVFARDLDGWFDHVWSVHPLVGADPADRDDASGPIRMISLAPRHTIIEAHVGRFRWLQRLPPLDLAVSQLMLIARLVRLVRREKVDVVRAGDPYYLGLLGLVLARVARIPLAIRINGNYDAIHAATGRLAYPRIFRRRSIEKRIDRFVLSRAALVAAPNQDNLDFALANGARPEVSAIFPYGNLLHPAHFDDPASRRDVRDEIGASGRPVIAYISRLEPVKRPEDLLVVAEALRDHDEDAAVVIVGDGSMHETLSTRAHELGISDRFLLPGNRSQSWIASLLAHTEVIAAPHNGRALVESALSGRPIVAYDSDWHRELIEDGVSGVLVADGDARAMADAVLALLQDPERAADIGAAGRARAVSRMDPRTLADLERAAYERILL